MHFQKRGTGSLTPPPLAAPVLILTKPICFLSRGLSHIVVLYLIDLALQSEISFFFNALSVKKVIVKRECLQSFFELFVPIPMKRWRKSSVKCATVFDVLG